MKRSLDLPLTIRPVVGMVDLYPAGYIDPLHKHERAQLCYALTGVMSVVTETSTFVLPPHRSIWLPAGTPHQVSCRGAVTLNILYLDPDQPYQPRTCWVLDASILVRALIEEILTFEHAYDETGREGQLVAVPLDEIGRLPSIPLSVPTQQDRRLRRVCDRIIADPADQRDLDQLAKIAGMGRRKFTRAFRLETGMAFAM